MGLQQVIELWKEHWQPQEWALTAPQGFSFARQCIEVVGPGGFAFDFMPAAVSVYHCSRWGTFITDEEHCARLRHACFEIAQFLGSEIAIYLPESAPNGFFEGSSLQQIEGELRGHFGEPAPSIRSINDAFDGYDLHRSCYYVDRFADLK